MSLEFSILGLQTGVAEFFSILGGLVAFFFILALLAIFLYSYEIRRRRISRREE